MQCKDLLQQEKKIYKARGNWSFGTLLRRIHIFFSPDQILKHYFHFLYSVLKFNGVKKM